MSEAAAKPEPEPRSISLEEIAAEAEKKARLPGEAARKDAENAKKLAKMAEVK